MNFTVFGQQIMSGGHLMDIFEDRSPRQGGPKCEDLVQGDRVQFTTNVIEGQQRFYFRSEIEDTFVEGVVERANSDPIPC